MHRIETYDSAGNLVEVVEREYTKEELLLQWQSRMAATDTKVTARFIEELIDAQSAEVKSVLSQKIVDQQRSMSIIDVIEERKTIRNQKPTEK